MLVKQWWKKTMLILSVLILVTIVASPVFAGDGDGSGGGQGEALQLVTASPADGQQDVKLPLTIQLTFNKNVVNMAVKDQNLKQISLATQEGQPVQIQVKMPDDQVDFAHRKELTILPQEELQPQTSYILTIAPEFQSKNGSRLGKTVQIHFVTAGSDTQSVQTLPSAPSGQLSVEKVGILLVIILVLVVVVKFINRKRK